MGTERWQMNKDIFEGRWKQVRGQARAWGTSLSDDDLDRAAGKAEQLLGLLQQMYGCTRERAEVELARRLRKLKAD